MSPHVGVVVLSALLLVVVMITVAVPLLPVGVVVLVPLSIVVIAALVFAVVIVIYLSVLGIVAALSPGLRVLNSGLYFTLATAFFTILHSRSLTR